jgi:hypothetical protein
MYTHFYTQKKKYSKYDEEHYLLYLGEQPATKVMEEGADPVPGYEYTGNFEDGGTMIKATEATYDQFVSGLIRSRYSADQVEAILLNIQSNDPDRMAEFQQELDTLNAYRDECKLIASELLE